MIWEFAALGDKMQNQVFLGDGLDILDVLLCCIKVPSYMAVSALNAYIYSNASALYVSIYLVCKYSQFRN